MNTKYKDLLILILYCGLIFWLSDRSGIPAPQFFPHQDKLAHIALYAAMGWLAWRFFRHIIEPKGLLVLSVISFCSLYGITDELHQSWVPGRDSDPLDWLADTIGATLAALLATSPRIKRLIS